MAKDHHYVGAPAAKFISRTAQPYHLLIVTPTSRAFPTDYLMSTVATVEALVRFGVQFDFHVLDGDCHVDDARNHCFREFLLTPCTDLLFIDSDMGWDAESVLKVLKHEGDIVAGVYRHKNDLETYPFHPGNNPRGAEPDGLFGMNKAPTGFMRIRRHVIEALDKHERERGRWHWDGLEDQASGKPSMTTICERAYRADLGLSFDIGDDSRRYSGDLVLCLKARNLGFSVRVDIDMAFTHVGEKAWHGHLGNHLRGQQNVDSDAFVAAVNAVKAGDATAVHFRAITNNSHNPSYALPGAALHACWDMAKEARGPILEMGSGLSTLVIGLALAGTDNVLYSLENDLAHFRKTQVLLSRYGVKNVVLHYVPLMPYEGFDWYGVEGLELPEFDAVVIDGPSRKLTPRDAAFKVIPELLRKARVWIVDDAADPIQAAMIKEHGADRTVTVAQDMSGSSPHIYAIASLAA